jgi:glycosyltransferase involved in cell wall biosynthesis
MRILRIGCVDDHRHGGMPRHMNFTSDAIRDLGHTVDIVWKADFPSAAQAGWNKVIKLQSATLEIARSKIASNGPYDVVDIHEPLAGHYAKRRSTGENLPPLIAHVYACEIRGHTEWLAYRRATGAPITWRHRISGLLTRRASKAGLIRANQITVEHNDDREYLRNRFGIPDDFITLMQGAVDLTRFPASEAAPDRRGILFVGSWIERKGVREIAQAVNAAVSRNPGLPITLAGVGCDINIVRNDLDPKVRDHVTVIEKITDPAVVARLYQSHAIYLLPSYLEGQPLVLLEAAASGMAIVATETCGMKDFIRHGENGLVVNPGDAAGFTQQVLRLVADADLARRLGEQARRDVAIYTWARCAEQFMTAAESAIRHATFRGRHG